MRLSFLVPLLTVAMMASVAGSSESSENFDGYLKELNGRIEAAVANGREWPMFPGGLAAFLFGQDAVVGRGLIFYTAEGEAEGSSGSWREVTISETSAGTWRVSAIRVCEESDAREFIERRDYLRQTAVERMGFDFVNQGPLELLGFLKDLERNFWVSPMLPFGWVQESDLPALVALLDSPESCANVESMLSSLVDTTRSTVGNEAAYLIEGFRKDRYPPRLNSTRPMCDIDEIKRWWEERSGT